MHRAICVALTIVPIGLGIAIALAGETVFELLFDLGPPGPPTLDSNIRFLGACFAGLGGCLWIAMRSPARYAPMIIVGGVALCAGVAARIISIVANGWPTELSLVLAGAELFAGLAYLTFGIRNVGSTTR